MISAPEATVSATKTIVSAAETVVSAVRKRYFGRPKSFLDAGKKLLVTGIAARLNLDADNILNFRDVYDGLFASDRSIYTCQGIGIGLYTTNSDYEFPQCRNTIDIKFTCCDGLFDFFAYETVDDLISSRENEIYGLQYWIEHSGYGAMFGIFLAQKLNKKPFTIVGNGKQKRDFTYVTDVVDAIIKSIKLKKKNNIINIGSGKCYSVNYIAKLLGGKKVYIPKRSSSVGELHSWASINVCNSTIWHK